MGVVDYPRLAERRIRNKTDEAWVSAAVAERRSVLTAPVADQAARQTVVAVAAPVIGAGGDVVAVVVGVTALATPGFLDLVRDASAGEPGEVLLISPADDMLIARSGSSDTGLRLPHDPELDLARQGFRGAIMPTEGNPDSQLAAVIGVPGTPWLLVARQASREALALADNAQWFILRNAVVEGVLATLLLGLGAVVSLRPLTRASREVHRMAAGELETHPLPVARWDEVGELVAGFNSLVERLDEVNSRKVETERLRVSEKERMARSLRQWMADSSHELRTPIAVLRAQIEAIQDGVHVVDASTLRVLHREIMGLSRLVDDMFTLARSDVGQMDMHWENVDVAALISEAIEPFRDRFASAGIALQWLPPEGQAMTIKADSTRLRQVISNLLENTLRYSDPQGRLRISCAWPPTLVVLYFDDSPPGVPPESLPNLFDRFYRVDVSRSRQRGGSGIGLAVCKSIIEAHGGDISADASPLGGLRVRIQFPRKRDEP